MKSSIQILAIGSENQINSLHSLFPDRLAVGIYSDGYQLHKYQRSADLDGDSDFELLAEVPCTTKARRDNLKTALVSAMKTSGLRHVAVRLIHHRHDEGGSCEVSEVVYNGPADGLS
jgi:hypothetical protein